MLESSSIMIILLMLLIMMPMMILMMLWKLMTWICRKLRRIIDNLDCTNMSVGVVRHVGSSDVDICNEGMNYYYLRLHDMTDEK